jgi:predicted transcriptional regulator
MARLSALGHQRLQNLAAKRGRSQQQVLDEALELLDRKQFFEEAHREYEALRADPDAAAELDLERRVIDGVLNDGDER